MIRRHLVMTNKEVSSDTNKVSIQDIASPNPSDKANRVIEKAMRESNKDQNAISAKAQAIRSEQSLKGDI